MRAQNCTHIAKARGCWIALEKAAERTNTFYSLNHEHDDDFKNLICHVQALALELQQARLCRHTCLLCLYGNRREAVRTSSWGLQESPTQCRVMFVKFPWRAWKICDLAYANATKVIMTSGLRRIFGRFKICLISSCCYSRDQIFLSQKKTILSCSQLTLSLFYCTFFVSDDSLNDIIMQSLDLVFFHAARLILRCCWNNWRRKRKYALSSNMYFFPCFFRFHRLYQV